MPGSSVSVSQTDNGRQKRHNFLAMHAAKAALVCTIRYHPKLFCILLLVLGIMALLNIESCSSSAIPSSTKSLWNSEQEGSHTLPANWNRWRVAPMTGNCESSFPSADSSTLHLRNHSTYGDAAITHLRVLLTNQRPLHWSRDSRRYYSCKSSLRSESISWLVNRQICWLTLSLVVERGQLNATRPHRYRVEVGRVYSHSGGVGPHQMTLGMSKARS